MDSKSARAKDVQEGRKLKESRFLNVALYGADREWEKEAFVNAYVEAGAELTSGDLSGMESDDSGIGQLFDNDDGSLYHYTDSDDPYFTGVVLGPKVPKALAWFKEGRFDFTVYNMGGFLINIEETITDAILERAKFLFNKEAYNKEALPVRDFDGPLVEFIFIETESVYAKIGRYVGKEEFPYFLKALPDQVLVNAYGPNKILHPGSVLGNLNEGIWNMYFDKLLPKLVHGGSDGNPGSSAAWDVAILQAISKRTHYSKFLAEAKFQESPEKYEFAILAEDKQALDELLNSPEPVEISTRRAEIRSLMQPDVAAELYDNWLLPMTKEVQLQYLRQRLNAT